jgi:AraC family transcriptional regulator of adaptative response/methylated-DNA-[protein]-cysteine methyltransferase
MATTAPLLPDRTVLPPSTAPSAAPSAAPQGVAALGAAELERVALAIETIAGDGARAAAVDLDRLAARLRWSRDRFDRVFRAAVGLSPARFAAAATLDFARRRLAERATVLAASHDAGLSSASRLHDLCVSFEGLTPGEWRRRGAGLELRYGLGPSPFGQALIARSARGLCALFFGTREETVADLAARFPQARLREDSAGLAGELAAIFAPAPRSARPFHLDLRGTPLQLAVWEALLSIPAGQVESYSDLARRVGRPSAVRAVASAVGRNPVSYLIPCHRVLRSTGELGGYRWGLLRKRALLAVEAERGGAFSTA